MNPGRVRPGTFRRHVEGDVVAVAGAGPTGLSASMGARLRSPSHIVAIDLADGPGVLARPARTGALKVVLSRNPG